jgi:hypothetical protein
MIVVSSGHSEKNSTLSLLHTLFRICTVPLTLYLVMFFKVDAFRHDVMHFLHHVTRDVTDLRVWLPVLLASVFGFCSVVIGTRKTLKNVAIIIIVYN